MLRLVLPKGSLEEQTLGLLEEADLTVKRDGGRDYDAQIDDARIGQVKILRPQEIPVYVERGLFDLGITGLDWVRENGSDVVEILDLGYNKQGLGRPVKLVLAVAEESAIAEGRQIRPGSRISTEYPQLTREYFERLGIPVEIMLSYGATEAKVPEIADAIVDLTESGFTLRRHGMKIVDVLLESTAKLIANKGAYADPVKRREMEEISTLLEGVLAARQNVLLKLNVHQDHLEDVIAMLPAMKAPTVAELFTPGYYAVETVVVRAEVNRLIPELKRRGAEDILELPILKIVK